MGLGKWWNGPLPADCNEQGSFVRWNGMDGRERSWVAWKEVSRMQLQWDELEGSVRRYWIRLYLDGWDGLG